MLLAMGWKDGTGLGAAGREGRPEPVLVAHTSGQAAKRRRGGVGFHSVA